MPGRDDYSTQPGIRTRRRVLRSMLVQYSFTMVESPNVACQRFAKLAGILPFLPVFGGGVSRFQPVYVGDIARAVEVASRDEKEIQQTVAGKILEAGGPEGETVRSFNWKTKLLTQSQSSPTAS
jgi:hypothetical protein